MKNLLSYIILLTFLLSGVVLSESVAFAQINQTPSGIPYDQIGKEIDRYIEDNRDYTSSVSASVFDGRNTLCKIQAGYDNIEEDILTDNNTVYEWGSVTKLLVWISVMQLYEQGKLDLTTDINTYLPENFLKRTYDEPITMLHLMHHSAGFQELVYIDETTDPHQIISLEESVKKFHPAQIYHPGSLYSYSNWGASLAAYIVERVSGQPFDSYVHEHIFSPLNIRHTALRPDYSDVPWVAQQRQRLHSYALAENGLEDLGQNISYILLYPAGSATGTLEDFMLFGQALVAGSESSSKLFRHESTMNTFQSPSLYYDNTDIPRSYHGLLSMKYQVPLMGHDGQTSSCSCSLMFDPIRQLGVVVMTNQLEESIYTLGIPNLIFGNYSEPSAHEMASLPKKDISGIYLSSRDIIKKGFSKIYPYLNQNYRIKKGSTKDTYLLGSSEYPISQVNENQYFIDYGQGIGELLVQKESESGSLVLQSSGDDWQRQNPYGVYFNYLLLFSGIIAFLYALLISAVMIFLLLKNNGQGTSHSQKNTPKTIHALTILSMLVSGVLVYLLLFYDGYLSMAHAASKAVPLTITALFPLYYFYFLVQKAKLSTIKRPLRNLYITTAIMSAFITLNIIYWQWYNFWSH